MRSAKATLGPLLVLCLLIAATSQAETVQSGNVRVSFGGQIAPQALPRKGTAPVEVTVSTKIPATKKAKVPPQLTHLQIAINRNGAIDPTGLPICPLEEIQPSTTQDALERCGDSLVGEGLFEAKVLLKGQASFPSQGKLYAYNSRLDGRPAILAHVYGAQPAPASFTLVFEVGKAKGTFGTVLSASLSDVTSGSGYITGLSMTLGKTFSYRGERRSYVAAGCPVPKGLPGASFPFARATLSFAGGKTVGKTLVRSCRAR